MASVPPSSSPPPSFPTQCATMPLLPCHSRSRGGGWTQPRRQWSRFSSCEGRIDDGEAQISTSGALIGACGVESVVAEIDSQCRGCSGRWRWHRFRERRLELARGGGATTRGGGAADAHGSRSTTARGGGAAGVPGSGGSSLHGCS
jgi:hypothetical protein